MYLAGKYDVIIIGGGHAGIEAAFAASRLGCSTCLFSMNLDSVANLPCNPNIGGTAKGHLVREIDALGGEMGKVADKTFIQSRILNRGKGPAVYSLRVQIDRRAYQEEMKNRLELQENLHVRQGEIVDITFEEPCSNDQNCVSTKNSYTKNVKSVITASGAEFECKAVIIATGTYLQSRIIIGEFSQESGPDGLFPSKQLSDCLIKNKIELRRFKTGTPARINKRTVDFSKMELQTGDEEITPFSFETVDIRENMADCYLTYTNLNTHQIIKDNLHRSPLFSGNIEGVGARYCPSIEDKIVRFADKDRHQIFIEPMGLNTQEMYVQGFSSSMPEEVQIEMLHSVEGLENAQVMRSAYAIEYDCINPQELYATLEFKRFNGLYGAGQFNGTSGYEEAAAQGLIAGINAALKVKGKPEFTLDRSEAYIGTLIDDLVSKGTNEPYRMMTSRSEYRLLLRQDNADLRLTPKGHEIGLISDERYNRFLEKKSSIEAEIKRLSSTVFPPSEAVLNFLKKTGSAPIQSGIKAHELLRRPEINYAEMGEIDSGRTHLPKEVTEQVEINIKYEGYISKQKVQAEQFKKLENKKIPPDTDYDNISGLRIEAKQKLNAIKPASIGQASRISGVSPADIAVLMVYLRSNNPHHTQV